MKQAIDKLSPEERAELRDYIDQQSTSSLHAGTMDVDKLLQAARKIRDGITDEEWTEITEAMSEEYIEPVTRLYPNSGGITE